MIKEIERALTVLTRRVAQRGQRRQALQIRGVDFGRTGYSLGCRGSLRRTTEAEVLLK